jgi:ABC-type multidrug transport system fused ATPase/permease subunit
MLILIGLVLLVIIIVVSLFKKAVKLAISIIVIIVVFSLVRVFVYGVSPVEEFNAYKTNITYGKDIAQYTGKIKTSTDAVKDIIESKKYDEASIKKLKEENDKLKQYQSEVQVLEHTEKLNFFHDRYCGYVNTIVVATDTTAKVAKAGDKTIQGADELLNKLKSGITELSSLKIK